jgi:hypothetical protein
MAHREFRFPGLTPFPIELFKQFTDTNLPKNVAVYVHNPYLTVWHLMDSIDDGKLVITYQKTNAQYTNLIHVFKQMIK